MRGVTVAAAAVAALTCTAMGTAPGGQDGPRENAATVAASGSNWPAFDGNAARTGVAAGVPAVRALATAWTARLDGAVYGQPLVIGNEVIAATENDSFYALNRATGTLIWRKHVGTPVPRAGLHGCGDIFPLGITGTPVYNPGNGQVYGVAETTGYHHMLVALSVTSGAVRLHRYLDVPTSANQPAYNQQRPALTITNGRVYAAFGGLAGDCGAYQGSVVSAPLSGDGPLTSWHTPTSREGGIWGTGGPVVGPKGALWISIGNGAASGGAPYDGSDSVTELSPELKRVAYFAPATWAADNASDLDLGSTQPVRLPDNALFAVGKRGIGYLLSAGRVGGIGGQLAEQSICAAYGAAAYSGSTVYEPCSRGGLAAIAVNAATKTIKVLWRGPSDGNGSPVIGGGAVWVTHYARNGGTLYALNQTTGKVEQQITISQGLPHFSSLSLSGGTAYVSTLTGLTAVNGA
jgi:outer membrane protein assembly factor BamB